MTFKTLARPYKLDDGSFNMFSSYVLLPHFQTGSSIFHHVIGRDYNKMVKEWSLKC